MKKRTVILLSILLVALIFAATIGYNALMKNYKADTLVGQGTDPTAQSGENSTPEKTPAADFTVYDQEGNEVKLSDYFGKPIVLNFWTSWCGPCKQEMPHFEKTFVERGKDIHFLMVNMTDGRQETKEKAQSYVDSQKYTMPIFFDLDQAAAITYGVTSLPTSYFIDAQGDVRAEAKGSIDEETLLEGIAMITEK